ncbi:MAG: ParB/RepB/Spo0J family partition protein [Ktedonobacteraceae bacterium]|nr:ParB/RepB/Spo0J family partition protein [Ktedonobacteraceae bacterium]
MAKQKFGLGRGLDALISGASDVLAPHAQQSSEHLDEESLPRLPIDSIIPNPRQPRRGFRDDDPALLELSNSIKEHGLLQPIVVTRLDKGKSQQISSGGSWFSDDDPPDQPAGPVQGADNAVRYQIIAGERRWRAARLAGLTRIPAVVKDVTAQQMLALALIENIQRADLNPIEEALAYQALTQEFGLTQEMVARQVGKDRSTITNALRLLQLAPEVREALINQAENFTEGHARALLAIAREDDQVKAMEQIIALRLTVRQAEELAARIKAAEHVEAAAQKISAPPRRSPELEDLETQFRNALTVKVDLKCNAKGKGTLVLHFNSQEELERLYHQLVKPQE